MICPNVLNCERYPSMHVLASFNCNKMMPSGYTFIRIRAVQSLNVHNIKLLVYSNLKATRQDRIRKYRPLNCCCTKHYPEVDLVDVILPPH